MQNRIISIIGLGYVGLPVAIAFGKHQHTIGFDINRQRIQELQKGIDTTLEVTSEDLQQANITFTDQISDLKQADFHIVAVPTPIDNANKPNLTPVIKASEFVGKALKKGDIVVYESTVYPGVTEEECVPILEDVSGLTCGSDFKVGYSPERINPGDKEHTFTKITKVVSGQDPETLEIVASVYDSVVTTGVYRAPSIKVAEAAKVIENTQRDLNIALMNELALIFDQIGIDTNEVLKAAATKWNFLKFKPGLVGGHCIGVDPYYLTHKAQQLGYHAEVILAGRKINDGMGKFIAQKAVKELIKLRNSNQPPLVTVLGATFKENCPDLRNSKVLDIVQELKSFEVDIQLHDTMASPQEIESVYELSVIPLEQLKPAPVVIVAVAHNQYRDLTESLRNLCTPNGIIIDVKAIYDPTQIQSQGLRLWRL